MPMSIEKIACNACGAPLEVLESTRFATCHHCGVKLSIQRTDSATFTEAIKKLEAVAERLEDRVGSLTTKNEIEALDRKWQVERERFMISTKDDGKELPTKGGALAGGLFGGAFALFWIAVSFSMTFSGPDFAPFSIAKVIFPLFGIGFFCMIVWNAYSAFNKAEEYEQAQRRYEARRLEMEARSKQPG